MATSKPDDERTATDDRIAENAAPAPIAPATRDINDTSTGGLPPGITDDQRSPLDPSFYADKDKKNTPN